MADIDEKLRGMAEHRGLKLVKSRRRKAGTGDFGKYGLVDAAGKALLGVGDDGLTASAGDIEAYLRKGAVSSWQVSAETTPERPAAVHEVVEEDEPVAGKRRKVGKVSPRTAKVEAVSEPEVEPEPEPAPEPAPVPEPEPVLVVRAAKAGDAGGIAGLLGQLTGVNIDAVAAERNLTVVRKAKGGMVVAELGEIVGCCGWALVPTVQHGLIGRLTVMVVDEGHRRRGIATAMFDAATAALGKAGCVRVEVMSDTEVRNSHNFFRALQFEQTSYRFARRIGE
ncbi:hypothetical protein GCM10011529_06280 [Polymorphobacter glacialis]|uniref:N-acetyltransferase domain-containing protein n=1 Tax=Sandarakinorhabdus glacialis TaxID=1614636 RepID=A0A916ZLC9_9SPHN|nr:GNAT family N-acetyltransferase [Polymorphobacter glacialis]GGE02548.1 hypothetical protein GCM10011529_06280 [Polymorphobacter glacialis]